MFTGENYETFLSESKKFIQKNKDNLNKNNVLGKFDEKSIKNFIDIENIAERVRFLLQKPIEELDKNLIEFEKNWKQNNGFLIWAENYDDVIRELRTIVWEHKIKNYYYNQKHYNHIWSEIGLFQSMKKEKVKFSENAEIQFIDADKLIIDEGKILILGDEYTINKLGNNSINVFVVGIEQLIKNLDDVEIYTEFLLNQKVNEFSTLHPIVYAPSEKEKNYLFILDNMRSNLMSFPHQRTALTCLHCGRCENVCPVLKISGETAYNNIFSGPLANITLPYLENIEEYKFISYACILCGECEKVCPINLPLRELIIENRQFFKEKNCLSFSENRNLNKLRKFLSNRKKMNKLQVFKQSTLRRNTTKTLRKNRKLPHYENQTFNQQYIKKLKEK